MRGYVSDDLARRPGWIRKINFPSVINHLPACICPGGVCFALVPLQISAPHSIDAIMHHNRGEQTTHCKRWMITSSEARRRGAVPLLCPDSLASEPFFVCLISGTGTVWLAGTARKSVLAQFTKFEKAWTLLGPLLPPYVARAWRCNFKIDERPCVGPCCLLY
jgi:hypothetical protein